MGSSTVKAQKLANETNETIAEKYNDTQKLLAQQANDLNYQMFNEQNQWNLDQWNRENEFNSPSQQMQRYIQAGINPVWAIGNGNPGNAQQLTSADAKPAEVPAQMAAHVEPESDPTKLSNIVAAANNFTNSIQGFLKLALESQDVNTRREAMQHAAGVQAAEALYKRSQTAGQEIFNNLNTRTFETQVSTKVSEFQRLNTDIDNAKKEGRLFDAELKNKEATYDQIRAMTNYTGQQANALLEQVKQGWKKLAIEQQNADTSYFSAHSSSYYEGESLKLENRKFNQSIEQFQAGLAHQTNEQILSWCNQRVGWLQKLVGANPMGYKFETPFGSIEQQPDEMIDKIRSAGAELINRIEKYPTQSNIQSYQEYLNMVNRIPNAPNLPSPQTLQGYSVLNPSSPWPQ